MEYPNVSSADEFLAALRAEVPISRGRTVLVQRTDLVDEILAEEPALPNLLLERVIFKRQIGPRTTQLEGGKEWVDSLAALMYRVVLQPPLDPDFDPDDPEYELKPGHVPIAAFMIDDMLVIQNFALFGLLPEVEDAPLADPPAGTSRVRAAVEPVHRDGHEPEPVSGPDGGGAAVAADG